MSYPTNHGYGFTQQSVVRRRNFSYCPSSMLIFVYVITRTWVWKRGIQYKRLLHKKVSDACEKGEFDFKNCCMIST